MPNRTVLVRRQPYLVGAVVLAAVLLLPLVGCLQSDSRTRSNDHTQHRALSAFLERNTDSLDASLVALGRAGLGLQSIPARDSVTIGRLRTAFLASRTRYKQVEGVLEFYAPSLAAALNSRRQEVDDDDAPPPSSLAPSGYPAIETLLWAADSINVTGLGTIVRGMRGVVRKAREISVALSPTDAQLIELARLELTRISTLEIAGFDTPLTLQATSESADALEGLRQLFAEAGAEHWPQLNGERTHFESRLREASNYLRANPDFEQFDRLEFIVRHAVPVAHALDEIRRAGNIVAVGMKRGWRSDIASVYDSGAFDSRAYAADDAPPASPELIALGERLFSDPILSGNGTRACGSCHQASHAFTDRLPRATHISGHGFVARHTPTLFNAALSPAQFADERAITLEEQVKRVIESPAEMASSLNDAAIRVRANANYAKLLTGVFPPVVGNSDSAVALVTGTRLRFALAAYVRSLEALNSRFDRAIRGDLAQITPLERRGFNVFMGRAGCGTCHFAPLFNGNTPPLYLSADVEVIGVPTRADRPAVTDPDSGRAAVDKLPLHYRAFKTPTVRNASHTAPFMHNGAFRTLDDVIGFYSNGGGNGAGARVQNQTLSSVRLNLSPDERASIVAFIGALSDTTIRTSAKQR